MEYSGGFSDEYDDDLDMSIVFVRPHSAGRTRSAMTWTSVGELLSPRSVFTGRTARRRVHPLTSVQEDRAAGNALAPGQETAPTDDVGGPWESSEEENFHAVRRSTHVAKDYLQRHMKGKKGFPMPSVASVSSASVHTPSRPQSARVYRSKNAVANVVRPTSADPERPGNSRESSLDIDTGVPAPKDSAAMSPERSRFISPSSLDRFKSPSSQDIRASPKKTEILYMGAPSSALVGPYGTLYDGEPSGLGQRQYSESLQSVDEHHEIDAETLVATSNGSFMAQNTGQSAFSGSFKTKFRVNSQDSFKNSSSAMSTQSKKEASKGAWRMSSLQTLEVEKKGKGGALVTAGRTREAILSGRVNWMLVPDMIEQKLVASNRRVAIVGLLGFFCSVAQNELLVSGYPYDFFVINILKFLNTILCAGVVLLLFSHYRLVIRMQRLNDHLNLDIPIRIDIPASHVFFNKFFWIEAAICSLHLPPYISDELPSQTMDSTIVYRLESLFCFLNSFKLYLFWRIVRDLVVGRLVKRRIVSRYSFMEFDSRFAFKDLFNHYGFRGIAVVWLFALLLLGYWYRIFEVDACTLNTVGSTLCPKIQNAGSRREFSKFTESKARTAQNYGADYYHNVLWFLFISTTTVGYGDVLPMTHTGRFIATAMTMLGLVLTAVLTAELSKSLEFTYLELNAFRLCRGDLNRVHLAHAAAKLVQAWWRRYKSKKRETGVYVQYLIERETKHFWKCRREYQRAKIKIAIDEEEMITMQVKLDAIHHRNEKTVQVIDRTGEKMQAEGARIYIAPKDECEFHVPVGESANSSVDPGFSFGASNGSINVPNGPKTPTDLAQRGAQKGMLDAKRDHWVHGARRGSVRGMNYARDVMLAAGKGDVLGGSTTHPTRRWQNLKTAVNLSSQLATAREVRGTYQERVQQYVKLSQADDWVFKVRTKPHQYFDDKLSMKEWWRSRESIHRVICYNCYITAILANMGTVCAVIQNELIFQSVPPDHVAVNALKAFNSIFTVAAIVSVLVYHYLQRLFTELSFHVETGVEYNSSIPWYLVLVRLPVWIEIILVAAHLPPGITFEVSSNTMDNIIVYRGETLMCLVSTVRLYLVWRAVRHRTISFLPKRFIVALYSNVAYNSKFTLKLLLNGWSMWYGISCIFCMWLCNLIVSSYWCRALEISSCGFTPPERQHPKCALPEAQMWNYYGVQKPVQNNLYYWEQLWGMTVTSLTVGYGDTVPQTHGGRIVAAECAIVGITVMSLLSASLIIALKWSVQEARAIKLCERERYKVEYANSAASVIAAWWRYRVILSTKDTVAGAFLRKVIGDKAATLLLTTSRDDSQDPQNQSSDTPRAKGGVAPLQRTGSNGRNPPTMQKGTTMHLTTTKDLNTNFLLTRSWHKLRGASRRFRLYSLTLKMDIDDDDQEITSMINKIQAQAKYMGSACEAVRSHVQTTNDIVFSRQASPLGAVGARRQPGEKPLSNHWKSFGIIGAEDERLTGEKTRRGTL